MLADHCPYPNVEMPKHELLEIRRSKISLHHAKEGYSYPTSRLPYKFSQLAGLSTRIYQTAEVAGSNPAEPIGFLGCFDEITGSAELFDFRFREEVI